MSTSRGSTSSTARPRMFPHKFLRVFPESVMHGLIAVVLVVLSQCLIWGLDCLLARLGLVFPSCIVGMLLVFVCALALNRVVPAVSIFYARYLKAPADIINRHMSIGFTVPFVVISRGPIASGKEIGLIICCFLITGITNSVLVYGLARGLLKLWQQGKRSYYRSRVGDVEEGRGCLGVSGGNPLRSGKEGAGIGNGAAAATNAPTTGDLVSEQRVPRQNSTATTATSTTLNPALGSSRLRGSSDLDSGPEKLTEPGGRDVSAHHGQTCWASAPQAPRLTKFLRHVLRGVVLPAMHREPLLFFSAILLLLLGLPMGLAPSTAGSVQGKVALDITVLVVLWSAVLAGQGALRRSVRRGPPEDEEESGIADNNNNNNNNNSNNNSNNNHAVPNGATSSWPKRQKARPSPGLRDFTGIVLPALLNPVLITSLLLVGYTWARAACAASSASPSQTPPRLAGESSIEAVLDVFLTGNPVSSLLPGGPPPHSSTPAATTPAFLGAGDLAIALLGSGLVVWGLRLFECRAALLALPGGAAVVLTAVPAAALCVLGGPAVASRVIVAAAPPLSNTNNINNNNGGGGNINGAATQAQTPRQALALAFVARSVTLALAQPVMARLGGDAALNAAMVVFSGVVFQVVAGLWPGVIGCGKGGKEEKKNKKNKNARVGGGAGGGGGGVGGGGGQGGEAPGSRGDGNEEKGRTGGREDGLQEAGGGDGGEGEGARGENAGAAAQSGGGGGAITAQGTTGTSATNTSNSSPPPTTPSSPPPPPDSDRDIATGITAGINAAAMGTAHLYEAGSAGAPYAALAMTVFGVATVLLVAVAPVAEEVVRLATVG